MHEILFNLFQDFWFSYLSNLPNGVPVSVKS